MIYCKNELKQNTTLKGMAREYPKI